MGSHSRLRIRFVKRSMFSHGGKHAVDRKFEWELV
jgi:hypothetical protein